MNKSDVEKIGQEYWMRIPGKPCSFQARSPAAKARLTRYKNRIKSKASNLFNRPFNGSVEMRLYYFHKGTDIDIDNFQKPILDSFTGIAYQDDNQVDGLDTKRIKLNSSKTIENVTTTLIPKALAEKKECVVICIKPIR